MRRALCLVGLALLAGACGGGGDDRPAVYAASSLTEVFRRLDPGAEFSFAGSDELATQIEQGARADVYAAASTKYPRELLAKELIERPRVFATNRLVLIVPSRNPARIGSVHDVARPRVKLVVGAAGVPIGDYTREVLAALDEEAALRRVVSEEQDVKGVVGKVALGEADAGFVYATDVAPVRDKVRAIELPDSGQPLVRYPIAVVADAPHAREARAFVALVLGPRGRAALQAAGFGLP